MNKSINQVQSTNAYEKTKGQFFHIIFQINNQYMYI
jgi:hypothetical protein